MLYHQFPIPEASALMDTFINGHRTKMDMPRADINSLTLSYVIKTLRGCAPDDVVTGDN